MSIREPVKLQTNERVDDRWLVAKIVGEGGFGTVYEVRDTASKSSGEAYALKVEDAQAPPRERVLRMEVVILRRMRMKRIRENRTTKQHFCDLEAVGQMPLFRYVVMTLVGKSLTQLRRWCGGKFGGRTVAHLAIESLTAIQEIHEIGYLHRDIKPSNMAIGRPPAYDDIYLIDFGLCRMYRSDDGRMRRQRDVAGFRGTLTYAPLSSHKNEDLGRKDDLWSWLYMMVDVSTGKLGWYGALRQYANESFKVQVERIGAIKEELNQCPIEMMTGCATEFLELHAEISKLGFLDTPNYEAMLDALRRMQERRRRSDKDGEKLDWEPGGKQFGKMQF